jgi:hypothetical protein
LFSSFLENSLIGKLTRRVTFPGEIRATLTNATRSELFPAKLKPSKKITADALTLSLSFRLAGGTLERAHALAPDQMTTSDSTPEARGDLTARFFKGASRSSSGSGRSGFSFFDRETLDQFCERGVLATVLAMLFWGALATGCTRTSQFLVLLGLGTLMCAFWLVRTWVRQQYRVLFPPLAWAVLTFVGYAIWRYSWVDYEYAARLELLQVLLYGLLFFAILDNLTSQENIQILLFSLIGLGMLEAFYGIFQYFTDSRHVLWFPKPAAYRGRGSGTYVCPNHLAGMLEMVLRSRWLTPSSEGTSRCRKFFSAMPRWRWARGLA